MSGGSRYAGISGVERRKMKSMQSEHDSLGKS